MRDNPSVASSGAVIFGRSSDEACSLLACMGPDSEPIVVSYPKKSNKSLHPIGSVVPAFASCSWGAANAGPPAPTGELNRYAEEHT